MKDLNEKATPFQKDVYELVKHIPKGKVTTYAEIAKGLGKPGATRAVGTALGKNADYKQVECFRIVRSDGTIGGFSRYDISKEALLEQDGIKTKDGKVVNLESVLHVF